MSNQFDHALDEAAEDEQDDANEAENSELDGYYSAASSGGTEKTIGFGVNEELHEGYKQLREHEEIDIDVAQNFRDQLLTLLKRHPEAAERAKKIIDVKRGEL